jgi:hypothetical protein
MATIDVTPGPICATMVVPPIPVLPSGITLAVALPSAPPFNVKLCCKILQLTPGIAFPPIVFPLNSAFITTINGVIRQINTYLRSVPTLCPRER